MVHIFTMLKDVDLLELSLTSRAAEIKTTSLKRAAIYAAAQVQRLKIPLYLKKRYLSINMVKFAKDIIKKALEAKVELRIAHGLLSRQQ